MKPLDQEPALTDRVRDAIVDSILDGTFQTGDRLAQEALAARLNVSRQPVSHALNLLKGQGVLVAFGRKGLTVAPMDPVLVRQLYQLRGPLDALAARLSAARIASGELSKRDLGGLHALVTRYTQDRPGNKTVIPPRELAARINADMQFHVTLYQLSGNPLIEDVTRAHWVHFRRSMRAVLTTPATRPPAWREHRKILDAVLCGDAPEAERLSIQHCQQAAEKATACLTNEGETS